MNVTIAYATPESQTELALELPPGATVRDALTLAATHAPFDGLDLRDPEQVAGIGVFNLVVPADQIPQHVLVEGDRVELYRPLVLDPMTARQRRAQQQG